MCYSMDELKNTKQNEEAGCKDYELNRIYTNCVISFI